MAEHTVLGLPLSLRPDGRLANAQPLCALVVVKALDDEGTIFHVVLATSDLHAVECLGMAEFAAHRIREDI